MNQLNVTLIIDRFCQFCFYDGLGYYYCKTLYNMATYAMKLEFKHVFDCDFIIGISRLIGKIYSIVR